jgi:hypothetical protein
MKTASAPFQLPFAPRPLTNELFSSWMLRVADANCGSLQELMLGFQRRQPDVPCPNSLDWGFPPTFLKAMAWFCRTSIGTLHSLDLRARLPQVEKALLLRFKTVSDRCLRLRKERVGYAFCPACISRQAYVHVHWEWVFPSCFVVMFTNVRSDTVVPHAAKMTPFPSAPLRLLRRSYVGAAERT